MAEPLSPPSKFAKKLASIAQDQFDRFHLIHEADPPLSGQIKKYWTTLGFEFPGVQVAWSAVFISFCVKTAGATADDRVGEGRIARTPRARYLHARALAEQRDSLDQGG